MSKTQNKKRVKGNKLLVGIDVAKEYHYAAFMSEGKIVGKPLRFENKRDGFYLLVDKIEKLKIKSRVDQALIAFEPTGPYGENLASFLKDTGYKVVIVNPAHTKRFKEIFDNSPAKADPKDAKIISELAFQGKYLTYIRPEGVYLRLRILAKVYEQRTKEITALRCKLHEILEYLFPEFAFCFSDILGKTSIFLLENWPTPEALLSLTKEELTCIVKKISRGRLGQDKALLLLNKARTSIGRRSSKEELVLALNQLISQLNLINSQREQIVKEMEKQLPSAAESRYLLSIKHIGVITVATLLGETGGFLNYHHPEEILKLSGLNLYQISSGKHKGQARISKKGRALLRKVLYQLALRQVKKDGAFYHFYQRKIKQGKIKNKVLIEISRKMVRILFAMIRDKSSFRADLLEQNNKRAA
jgi:transposase